MEDKTIYIEDSSRTARRQQQKRLGSSAVAYLVELITNSDDSYKRLESAGFVSVDEVKPIYIELKKKDGSFILSVTDNAEGMTSERVESIFKKYGGDNAGGDSSASRGIFGQGATDVMVNASMDGKPAMLESIKDDVMCKYYFGWDNQQSKRTVTPKKVNFNKGQFAQVRKSLRIPGNGTRMTFGVPSSVKFKEKTILDELEGSYALRYILSSKNRKVVFVKNDFEQVLSSEKYLLQESNLLANKKFNFDYEDSKLSCEIFLYRNPNKKEEGDYKTEILVTDSNQVIYANTFFGFEKMPKAKDISGVLKIDGLYELCKKHLNQEHPDEIINDDRTGFNSKHDFYKLITNKHLDKIISDCINEHSTPTEEVDITKNKKFKSALQALNKWMSEELKRDIPGGGSAGKNPPSDGLDFGKIKIEITKGVSYDLKLLINPQLITPEDDIFVDVSDNADYISYTPDVITYSEGEIKDNKVVKSISLNALNVTPEGEYVTLTVSSKSYTKSIAIYVLDVDIIYPNDGIDFELKDETFTEKGNHKSTIWFDTDVYELGTKVKFSCKDLILINESVELTKEMLITDNIGKFVVQTTGGIVGNDYELELIVEKDGLVKKQIIHIRNEANQKQGSKGMFTSIKLWDGDDDDFQITFNEKTGIIYIAPKSRINIAMMGDLSNLDPENPKFSPKQYQYITDLLAYHSAMLDVKELERKNDIEINEDERLEDYNKKISSKKAIIFDRLTKAMEEA